MKQIETKKIIVGAAAIALAIGIGLASQYTGITDSLAHTKQVSSAAVTRAGVASTSASQASTTQITGKIDINTAREAELTTLSGIGLAKATAIINYRIAHGLFYTVEDIMKVKGIGNAIFNTIQNKITVGDVQPPKAQVTARPTATLPVTSANVFISAVVTGIKGNTDYAYIELYNAGAMPSDLSGWSIKKMSSTGSISTIVSTARFKGMLIPAGKHLLLVHGGGYTGSVAADIAWPASYSLSADHNALALYNAAGEKVDLASWSSIPIGKSYARATRDSPFEIVDPNPRNSSE